MAAMGRECGRCAACQTRGPLHRGALALALAFGTALGAQAAVHGAGADANHVEAKKVEAKKHVTRRARSHVHRTSNSEPLGFRLGGATLIPLGFVDFTSLWRSSNTGSGIVTNFANIPFSDTPAGQLSQFNLSAQNSKLGVMVRAHVGHTAVRAYAMAWFTGTLPENGHVSNTVPAFRMQLFWADLRKGPWDLMVGQDWSLLTPSLKGLSPMPSDVFVTANNDPNYQVGLTWAIQAQVRLIRHFSRHWTLGFSLENPDQYIGPNVVVPDPSYLQQFDSGSNTTTPNAWPDMIAKIAYDGRWGRHRVHAELGGLLSRFHSVTPVSLVHHAALGGGVEADGNAELFRHVRLFLDGFYSQGGGRYIFHLGPDVVVRPNGAISPVHTYSTLDGFGYRITPTTTLSGYYGLEYNEPDYSLGPNGYVGFAYPGAPDSTNRELQEYTLDLQRTFWRQRRFGALQLVCQCSYIQREPWTVRSGAPGYAHATEVYADLRYLLP